MKANEILVLSDRDAGIGDFRKEVAPGTLAFGLPAHQLDDGRRPHRLDEMRLFLGTGENLLFHPVPHPGIEGEDKSQMQEEGEDHDRA